MEKNSVVLVATFDFWGGIIQSVTVTQADDNDPLRGTRILCAYGTRERVPSFHLDVLLYFSLCKIRLYPNIGICKKYRLIAVITIKTKLHWLKIITMNMNKKKKDALCMATRAGTGWRVVGAGANGLKSDK